MFEKMMSLVEQQDLDGEIRRSEFDTANPDEPLVVTGDRGPVEQFVYDATPPALRFSTADGRRGVTFFDRRGRAATVVVADMSEDDLMWVALQFGYGGRPLQPGFTGSRNYWAPVEEGTEKLVGESRREMEKYVWLRTAADSKTQRGGARNIIAIGEAAKALDVKPYDIVSLTEVSDLKLILLARAMGYSGSMRTEALANAPTFTRGVYYHIKSQTQDVWFYPLEDQKNGGLAGLQSAMKDNGRFPSPVKKTMSSGDRRTLRDSGAGGWKEETPPAEVRAKFEAHPDFKGSAKTEDSEPSVHRSRDMMDPVNVSYWVEASEMDQSEFEDWLRKNKIRYNVIKKANGRFTAEGREMVEDVDVLFEGLGMIPDGTPPDVVKAHRLADLITAASDRDWSYENVPKPKYVITPKVKYLLLDRQDGGAQGKSGFLVIGPNDIVYYIKSKYGVPNPKKVAGTVDELLKATWKGGMANPYPVGLRPAGSATIVRTNPIA